jgi:hypothetical protein
LTNRPLYTLQSITIAGNATSFVGGPAIPWGANGAAFEFVTITINGTCSNLSVGTKQVLFVEAECICADQCQYELTLNDTFGDAWDGGNYFEVYDASTFVLIGTYGLDLGGGNNCLANATPCSQTYSISVCPNTQLQFVYVGNCATQAGPCWASDESWSLVSPASAPLALFSGADGSAFDYTELTCPSCPAPNAISCSTTSAFSINVTFNSFNLGAAYSVYYSNNPPVDGNDTGLGSVNGISNNGSNTASVTGLNPGTAYFFWVVEDCDAMGAGDLSLQSASTTCTTQAACAAPTAIACSANGGSTIAVSYTSTSATTQQYYVFYSLDTNSDINSATQFGAANTAAPGNNSVTVTGLLPLTGYNFWVVEECMVDPGTGLADYGDQVQGPTACTTLEGCPVPTAVSCTALDNASIAVNWNTFNGGAGYSISYNTVDIFSDLGTVVGTTGFSASGANSATVSGLTSATQYYFWVVEDCESIQAGLGSSVVSASTTCTTIVDCPPATDVTCTPLGTENMEVSFTSLGAGYNFTVWQSADAVIDGGDAIVATGTTVIGTNNVYALGLATPATHYFYVEVDCPVSGVNDVFSTVSTGCDLEPFDAPCNYALELWDSWGDGWNNNTVDVFIDAVFFGNFTVASGQSNIVQIPVSDGAQINISYNPSGSYQSENAFQLRDVSGAIVATEVEIGGAFGQGPSDDGFAVLTGTYGPYTVGTVCPPSPDCASSTGLSVTTTSLTSANVSWSGVNIGTGYTLSWGLAPYEYGVDTPLGVAIGTASSTSTANTVAIDITSLSCGSYQVALIEDCNAGQSLPIYAAFSQGASNDLCVNAEPIACGDIIACTTVGATPSADRPLGSSSGGGGNEEAADIWYVFTGVASGTIPTEGQLVTLSTCNNNIGLPGSAAYDTKIDVYTGACGALTFIGGSDDGIYESPGVGLFNCGGFSSRYNFQAGIGVSYYVRLSGYSGADAGAFELAMTCVDPCLPSPASLYNPCSAPESLTLQTFGTTPNVFGTTECAEGLESVPSCVNQNLDWSGSWYQFTTNATGQTYVSATFPPTGPSGPAIGFAVYTQAACDGPVLQSSCNVYFSGETSATVSLSLLPNTSYKLVAYTLASQPMTYNLVVTGPPPPPSNDECSGALDLVVGTGNACTGGTAGTLIQATQSPQPLNAACGFQNSYRDVWFRAVVPAGRRIIFNYTAGTASNGILWSLYTAPAVNPCNNLTFISSSCNTLDPKTQPGRGAIETQALTPGDYVYVRLWAPNNSFTGTFTICATDPVPVNDQCSSATAVAVSEYGTPAWTSGNTRGAFEGNACEGAANEQVWYSFVATDPVHSILVRPLSGGTYNAVVELFDACGGTSLGCRNNYGASTIERALYSGLTPGNTYYYSVHSFLGAIGSSAAQAHETFVQGFRAGTLRAPYCGVLNYNLVQSIYAQADSYGELYTSPTPTVNGYGFRFQELPSGLDVVVQNPVTDGFYLQLQNVPGLEYGKQYDVSVQHRVIVPGNGTVDQYWSGFGPACTIGLSALPTTNIRPQYCGGTGDFYLANQLLAVQLSGASQYRFNFTPTGGGTTISELSSNYAVSLYNVGPIGGPGLLYGVSYDVTVEALITGLWTPAGTVCTIFMESQPEDTGVKAQFCNGTYLFPNSNYILAELVLGATKYEYKFTPTLGGTALTEIKNTISFAFHTTSLPFVSGTTYDVEVRAYAGGVWGDYSTMCPITVQAAPSVGGGDQTIAAKKLDASAVASLYPNPNLGESLYVSLTGLEDKPQHVVIEIMDVTGKMVYAQDVANTGKSANIILNFNEKLSKGMYFVNIYMDDTMLTEKLSIE